MAVISVQFGEIATLTTGIPLTFLFSLCSCRTALNVKQCKKDSHILLVLKQWSRLPSVNCVDELTRWQLVVLFVTVGFHHEIGQ